MTAWICLRAWLTSPSLRVHPQLSRRGRKSNLPTPTLLRPSAP
jgi:hypothetical protein